MKQMIQVTPKFETIEDSGGSTESVEVGGLCLCRAVAGPGDRCWGRQAQTGPGQSLMFAQVPYRVRLAGEEPTVLTPAIMCLAGPSSVFVPERVGSESERCLSVGVADDAMAPIIAEHDPCAGDPRKSALRALSPADPLGAAAVRRLAQIAFDEGGPIDAVWLEEALLLTADRCVARACATKPRDKRNPGVCSDAIRQVCVDFAVRFAEPLGLDDVESITGYTRGHVCRVFRRQVGVSVHGYLTLVRVLAVTDRLPAYRGKINALARETGFCSHAHLTKTFARTVGVTPSAISDAGVRAVRDMLRERIARCGPGGAP